MGGLIIELDYADPSKMFESSVATRLLKYKVLYQRWLLDVEAELRIQEVMAKEEAGKRKMKASSFRCPPSEIPQS